MTTASHRPLSPGMIALFGVTGAMLLGGAIAQTIPTGMLERNADDWRSRLPQSYGSLTYVSVGSAPESVEFGRRPLDPALLAGEVIADPRISDPVAYPRMEPLPVYEPDSLEPVTTTDEASSAVIVHRGSQSPKTAERPASSQSTEPLEPAAAPDQADLPSPASAAG